MTARIGEVELSGYVFRAESSVGGGVIAAFRVDCADGFFPDWAVSPRSHTNDVPRYWRLALPDAVITKAGMSTAVGRRIKIRGVMSQADDDRIDVEMIEPLKGGCSL